MAIFSDHPICTPDDLTRFEAELSLDQRLPEKSILDVFIAGAERQPEHTAITMVMSGAPDEQPRRVSYGELLGRIRSAANLFSALGGPRPGVAYMLPSLIETHVTLWGAETAGYAVPVNFLLQPDSIAELLKASGATILVALGPHPQLDIWQKAKEINRKIPGLTLIRVSPPQTPQEKSVIDFGVALIEQPDDHLIFGEPGGGGDVAAYFHTGGTTGTGFHRYNTARELAQKRQQLRPSDFFIENWPTIDRSAVYLKYILGQINPYYANLFHGCLLFAVVFNTTILAYKCWRRGVHPIGYI